MLAIAFRWLINCFLVIQPFSFTTEKEESCYTMSDDSNGNTGVIVLHAQAVNLVRSGEKWILEKQRVPDS